MRLPLRPLFFVLLLLSPLHALAGQAYFIDPDQIDLTRLLAPPPAVGSPRQEREMAELVALGRDRTPVAAAFAMADRERTAYRFADVLGPAFTADAFPLTGALLAKVNKDASAIVDRAKTFWSRPRPFVTNPDLAPSLKKPDGHSYPSGHATFGTLAGIILADMVPEMAGPLFERAEAYRRNRVIGGVHYPSDVEAGRLAGTVIAAFLPLSPAFREEFARARAELRAGLGLR